MTGERHMVTIDTELTGPITLTPSQFDMMLEAALVGLECRPDDDAAADALFDVLSRALVRHSFVQPAAILPTATA